MATLIVTTKDDVVNASDSMLSLREALAAADATPTVWASNLGITIRLRTAPFKANLASQSDVTERQCN